MPKPRAVLTLLAAMLITTGVAGLCALGGAALVVLLPQWGGAVVVYATVVSVLAGIGVGLLVHVSGGDERLVSTAVVAFLLGHILGIFACSHLWRVLAAARATTAQLRWAWGWVALLALGINGALVVATLWPRRPAPRSDRRQGPYR